MTVGERSASDIERIVGEELKARQPARAASDRKKHQDAPCPPGYTPRMIRHIVLACALLVPTIASAQTAGATGAPVVFFSIFGPEGENLQQFYSGLFDWKIAPNGDVMTAVSSPLPANIGKGEAETLVYVGVDDINATLAKVKERGGTIRYPRFEVPGRVILAVFKDPTGNSVGLVELENGKAKVPPAK